MLPYAKKNWPTLKAQLLTPKKFEDTAAVAASKTKDGDEDIEDGVDGCVEETKDVDDPLNIVDALMEMSEAVLDNFSPIDAVPTQAKAATTTTTTTTTTTRHCCLAAGWSN